MRKLFSVLFLLGLSVAVRTAFADPLGSSVTGALYSTNNPTNFFDPIYGVVPAGYGNSAGATTVAIGSGTEFGAEFYVTGTNDDGSPFVLDNIIKADFTATGVTIQAIVSPSERPFEADFTDLAFTGFTLVSSDPNFSYSYSGNTLKVLFAGADTPGTYSTTLNYVTEVAPTPEPSSLMLLGTGVLGAFGVGRRRFLRS